MIGASASPFVARHVEFRFHAGAKHADGGTQIVH